MVARRTAEWELRIFQPSSHLTHQTPCVSKQKQTLSSLPKPQTPAPPSSEVELRLQIACNHGYPPLWKITFTVLFLKREISFVL